MVDMCGMFSGCSLLKELYIPNFNTRKVTDMKNMFSECSSLKDIYISKKFNLVEIEDEDSIFSGCSDEFKNKIRKLLKI